MARGSKVWLNGKLIPEEESRITLFTHALHYGTGAFEGIRAYKQKAGGGGIFRLHDHIVRLFDSMKIMGVELPFSISEIEKACVDICKANGFEECYIRPIAFIGDGPLGIYPGKTPPIQVAVLTWEWGSYLGDEGIKKGVRLKTSSFIRPHVNSIMTKGKITGHYVAGVLAKKEAVEDGYDEGLFLDPQGYLSEGTGENLFVVKDGKVKTTALTSILSGITRKTIMEHLKRQGHELVEATFTRDELWCADEVFLTGTAAEVTPVREIDRRMIGEGRPGPITSKLIQDYQDMVRGTLPEYGKEWVTRF